MPGVERLIIRTLEARATEAKDLDVVAEAGPHDLTGHVRGVGNALGRRQLTPGLREGRSFPLAPRCESRTAEPMRSGAAR